MKKENDWWAVPLGVCLLIIIFSSLSLIAAGGWDWFADFIGREGAGWAQAFGSVAAIFAAFKMGRAQMEANRVTELSRRAYEDYRKILVIDALLQRLEISFQSVKIFMDISKYPVFVAEKWHQEQIKSNAKSIKDINLFDCPSFSLISQMTLIPASAESFSETIGEYMKVLEESVEEDIKKKIPGLKNGFTVSVALIKNARKTCKEEIELLKEKISIDI